MLKLAVRRLLATILVILAIVIAFSCGSLLLRDLALTQVITEPVMASPEQVFPEPTVEVEENIVAYCDKVTVCQGGYCGAGNTNGCNPNLWFWGHSSDGSDTAFRILLRDKDGNVLGDSFRTTVQDGYYRWVGGLVSQRCDGFLATSAKNKGQPWNACDFLVPAKGAGGYALSQYVDYQTQPGSLHVHPEVTYIVQVLASPMEVEKTPDGKFLHRWSLSEWNWDAICQVPLHIYYKDRVYKCDEVSSGEIPYYQSPEVMDIAYQITNDDDHQGYANVSFTFTTDIVSQGQIYYQVASGTGCDPTSGWHSDISSLGVEHTVSLSQDTLWYDIESSKTYCYQVITWLPEYKFVDEAKGISEIRTFTIPSN